MPSSPLPLRRLTGRSSEPGLTRLQVLWRLFFLGGVCVAAVCLAVRRGAKTLARRRRKCVRPMSTVFVPSEVGGYAVIYYLNVYMSVLLKCRPTSCSQLR